MTEVQLIEHIGGEPDEIGHSVEYEKGFVQTSFECDDLALEVGTEFSKVVSVSIWAIETN